MSHSEVNTFVVIPFIMLSLGWALDSVSLAVRVQLSKDSGTIVTSEPLLVFLSDKIAPMYILGHMKFSNWEFISNPS